MSEIAVLRDLALRSKAYWGYGADFLAACEAELTLCADEFTSAGIAVVDGAARPVGLVQVSVEGMIADLSKLFVDPDVMGEGIGRRLLLWAVSWAQGFGATSMTIEADPDAVPFYEHMGAVRDGWVPSGSIAERQLPRLVLEFGNG